MLLKKKKIKFVADEKKKVFGLRWAFVLAHLDSDMKGRLRNLKAERERTRKIKELSDEQKEEIIQQKTHLILDPVTSFSLLLSPYFLASTILCQVLAITGCERMSSALSKALEAKL